MTYKEFVELQRMIIRHTSEFFHGDPSCPCIVISFLPKQKKYYFSIKRFRKPFGRGSQVVVSTKSFDFHEGIHRLAHDYAKWVEQRIIEGPANRFHKGKITRIYNILEKAKQDE